MSSTTPKHEAIAEAIERAFDHRGDVTIRLRDGRQIVGYIFDRKVGKSDDESFVRVMGGDSPEKMRVLYREIETVSLTGRDMAAGKSFETWVKKYAERKKAGEKADLHPEPLDTDESVSRDG